MLLLDASHTHIIISINVFNDHYLNELIDKLSKENKIVFLLGEFNINLLNYDINPPTKKFPGSLSSQYFNSHILQPTRVKGNSEMLIDIFSNMGLLNTTSVNLTGSMSHNLPQFLVAPNNFSNSSYSKSNKYSCSGPPTFKSGSCRLRFS